MNISNIDYQFLLDIDSNPIIVFNNDGKIVYLNDNGEILMGYAKVKEIFSLAINNAPKEYGVKNTQIELTYNHLHFYAINVGYLSDEWIGIRFYYRPRARKHSKKITGKDILTDINQLLGVAIDQFTIASNCDIRLFTDQDISPTLLNQNSFSKLLRKTLSQFRAAHYLDITLKFNIGDHVVINNKQCRLINLKFASSARYCSEDSFIDELSNDLNIQCNLQAESIAFEIPLITD